MFSMYFKVGCLTEKRYTLKKIDIFSSATNFNCCDIYVGGTDTNIYLCGLKDPENIMKHHTGV